MGAGTQAFDACKNTDAKDGFVDASLYRVSTAYAAFTMLRILIKVVTATAIVTLVLMSAGDHLREMIPERHHQAVWLTGVMLFCFCVLVAAIVRRSSPVNQRRLENMLLTGVVFGALLFLLFISEMKCSMRPSARGSTFSCRYTGEL